MKKVKITVVKKARYADLIAKYENPLETECSVSLGQTFVCENGEMPEGFCGEAWKSVSEFVKTLAEGGGNFFDGWMKNPHGAVVCCNDGFRPVSFLVETEE